jgi:hypothetical protein
MSRGSSNETLSSPTLWNGKKEHECDQSNHGVVVEEDLSEDRYERSAISECRSL